MKISVSGHSKFKSAIGKQEPVVLEITTGTLLDALRALSEEYGEKIDKLVFDPETKEVKRSNLIFLNGQSYLNLRNRLGSELKDGDEIMLMPTMVGG